MSKNILEQVEISTKYSGYINKQSEEIKKLKEYESTKLPVEFDYNQISNLSTEVKQVLNKQKPETIGQATRTSGIPPSAINIILIYLKRNNLINERKKMKP